MNFAENNRISHRQLYRQLILTFLPPFFLCLFQEKRLNGISGIVGTITALGLLLLYVIFLIRLAPYFENLHKSCGLFLPWVTGFFFLTFTILTDAYLVEILTEVVPKSLLEGVSEIWIRILAVFVCAHGTYRGMQRRGRMAEVTGGIFLAAVLLMMLLCLGQANREYFAEMLQASDKRVGSFWNSTYGMICAFSGISLLPFLLPHVEKPGSAWKPAAYGILTIGVVLLGMLILFPAVFGWERLQKENVPIFPLLSGADLPGKMLARFDVLWMGILIYGLLYTIGSLFHYSHQIIALTFGRFYEGTRVRIKSCPFERHKKLGQGRTVCLGLIVFFLSVIQVGETGIEDCYFSYLGMIFVPGLLLIQLLIMLKEKGRRKKRIAMTALSLLVLFLSGCGGVEPEKRMYPLSLIAEEQDGKLIIYYEMPDLPKTTGQGKAEEGEAPSLLRFQGADFAEIEREYNQSQEKYLDLGHLQVVILEEKLISSGKWKRVLEYLKEECMVGEDIYVFQTEETVQLLKWQKESGTTIGMTLKGILENDNIPREHQGVTLRQVYHDWYEKDALIKLPEIKTEDERIEILA